MPDGSIAVEGPTDDKALVRALVALKLIDRWRSAGPGGLLCLTNREERAEHLGANIHSLFPACPVMVFPRWDCLPYDPAGPSREIMGRRTSVLRQLAGASGSLVISTV